MQMTQNLDILKREKTVKDERINPPSEVASETKSGTDSRDAASADGNRSSPEFDDTRSPPDLAWEYPPRDTTSARTSSENLCTSANESAEVRPASQAKQLAETKTIEVRTFSM